MFIWKFFSFWAQYNNCWRNCMNEIKEWVVMEKCSDFFKTHWIRNVFNSTESLSSKCKCRNCTWTQRRHDDSTNNTIYCLSNIIYCRNVYRIPHHPKYHFCRNTSHLLFCWHWGCFVYNECTWVPHGTAQQHYNSEQHFSSIMIKKMVCDTYP